MTPRYLPSQWIRRQGPALTWLRIVSHDTEFTQSDSRRIRSTDIVFHGEEVALGTALACSGPGAKKEGRVPAQSS
jgi:hypothetical protein